MIELVRQYYETPRNGSETVFSIWERGEAYFDSVTPCTWDPAYRSWITKIIEETVDEEPAARILSVGCGNAFVESDLTRRGYDLSAIDVCPDAVVLARRKGVIATEADVNAWKPDRAYNLIYCDGVVGHLFRRGEGCQSAFRRMRGWLVRPAGSLLVSNDTSLAGQDIQEHPSVQQFFLFSSSYLERELVSAGFQVTSSAIYTYTRPLSGKRSRAVIIARYSD
jgi:2-polyprenyl-3-methyl-5-hydroxy-6-metoxy-1,4-benzoquinol methylase